MNLEFLNVTMKNHSEDFTSLPHTLECGRQVQTLEKKSPCYQNIIEGRVCVLRPMGYAVTKTSVTTNSLKINTNSCFVSRLLEAKLSWRGN